MKRQGKPAYNELVVIKVAKVFPNSVSAELIECTASGMTPVSEVGGRWVHDIRQFVRENEVRVARVVGTEGHQVSLSLKKVRSEEAASRLNEFKRESKAEKILEQALSTAAGSPQQGSSGTPPAAQLDRVGGLLREQFGSLTKAFEFAYKNPSLFRERAPKEFAEALIATAQKRFTEKTYELRGKLTLPSYKPDGLRAVKAALSAIEGQGIGVKYISAPNYLLIASGKHVKELESRLTAAATAATKAPGISEGAFAMEKKG